MSNPILMLDTVKWARRARAFDIFTLALMPLVGVALIRDSYNLAQRIGSLAAPTSINALLLDVGIGALAFAWIAFRLVGKSATARAKTN